MGQKTGEKWTVAAALQPTFLLPPRLLGHAPSLLAQTTWKLATGYRAESFHTQNITQFSREVEQATRGQLLIEVHPNNTKYHREINDWFPKNVVFINSKAFDALTPEARSWTASQALAVSATDGLRANGIKVERIPADLDNEIKRMGERFSREWVRSVGNEANAIFVPYYIQ